MPAVQVIKKKTARKKRQKDRKPLLSHSSILILSGFLIGVVVRRMANPSVEVYVFAAGLIGIFCYLALDRLAQRRQQRAERIELEQANNNLDRRISRHIPQEPQVRSSRPLPVHRGTERQYQTVVSSSRYRYRYP